MRSRSAGAGWAALVLVLAVAAYGVHKLMSPVDPPNWIYEIDLRSYFFPSLGYAGAQLAQGTIPLWAPGQLLGVPFAAALQPAVFYPLLLPLVVLLNTEHALIVHAVVHLVLAGVFTWVYLRTVGLAWTAALLGALAYMLSPEITHSLYNTAFLSSRVWLPALFAAIHLVVETPTRVRCASLALVVAMLFLSGSAQCAVYTLQAGGLYAVFVMALAARRSAIVPTAGLLMLGVVLGLGMAAVQLGPTFELVSDGVRSLEGVNLLRAGGMVDGEATPAWTLASVLMRQIGGVVGVALPVAALFDRSKRGLSLFFLALFVVTCDFQRGNAGLVFPLYFRLPSGDLFTVSTRIDYVSGFAAACLVGFGVQTLCRATTRLPRSLFAVATAAAALAVLWPRYTDERTPRAWPPIVDAARMYGEPAVIEAAQKPGGNDRVFVFQHPKDQRIPPRAGLQGNIRVLYDYEPLLPGSYRRFFSIDPALRWRGRLTPVSGGLARSGGGEFAVSMRVLDSLAVRHYLDARGAPGSPSRMTERKTALPRAYAVDRVSYAASDEAALATVRGATFDPLSQVVLTSTANVLEESDGTLVSDVRFVSDLPDEVVLEATCGKPCVVVLSDLAYPGWNVQVDARPTDLLKANYLLRAVPIPAGTHEIRYRYRPSSFTMGAAISALSALGVLAMLLRRYWPM